MFNNAVAQVGVCYGQLGNNLPPPSEVVALYKQNNITRMRLYEPDQPTLQALSGSGIELMLGVPDADLAALAKCQCRAEAWVEANVACHGDVNFRYIAVGNEIHPTSENAPFVLAAMQNVYKAISAAGLGNQIRVSTSIKTDILEKSYPPNEGAFNASYTWYIKPIVEFLRDTGAPILANVYPYFAYMEDSANINLSFALLQPCNGVYAGGVYYDNLFYAILDAVYTAMEKILAPSSSFSVEKSKSTPGTTVSETGHSSRGHHSRPESLGDGELSTVENARIYNNNLMRVVKTGTPKRPDSPIEAYIFAMFDENQKPGEEYERNFGIFYPNKQPKYPLRFY